jgi:hypothetical protein
LLAIALGLVLSSRAYREGQTGCQTAPASRAEVTFRLIGTTTTTVASTDSAGRYRIALKPGMYDAIAGNRGGAKRITVVAGKSLTVDLAYTIQLL